jgi:hypothetical protein
LPPCARLAEIWKACFSSGHGACFLRAFALRFCLTISALLSLIDGEIEDQAFEGSMADVVRLLEFSGDSQLIKKHSLWVVQRDADAGIRVSEALRSRPAFAHID